MNKWTMVTLLGASLLSLYVVQAQDFCEDTPIIWRNDNMTCPERAICADVFLTSRDLTDGTQCDERRTIHHCLCPGDSICPFGKAAHRLYASPQQQQYMCQTVCALPFCNNIRIMAPVSQTTIQNAPNFGGRTYTRMNCRCPRHHMPYGQTGMHRAVQASPQRFGTKTQRQSTDYLCSATVNENLMPDPCDN